MELVGPDAVDRRDGAAEHVVAAAELLGALDRDDVLVLLHDAQHRLVAPRVTADAALLVLGDVEADRAEPHPGLDLEQHLGQPAYVGRLGLQQVERDALRSLGTHARQSAELVDQVLDDAFVQGLGRSGGSGRSRAGPGRRPRPGRRGRACRRRAGRGQWRRGRRPGPWRRGRRRRSGRRGRSRSDSLEPSNPPGRIATAWSSPTPLTVTVTAPPPTVPSSLASVSRCWAPSSCSCICWAWASRPSRSKPPPPPSASKGLSVMGSPVALCPRV